jgi:hypothetical protein
MGRVGREVPPGPLGEGESMASEERETLTELITEAHQVTKDLRTLLRQAQLAQGILERTAREAVDESITAIVEEGLAAYSLAIDDAIKTSTESVYNRFTELSAILLGETKKAIRSGDSVEDQIAAVRRVLHDRGYE